jgi:hypothetical protein
MRYMMFIKHTEDYRNAQVPGFSRTLRTVASPGRSRTGLKASATTERQG